MEDDPSVRMLARRGLEREGYTVLEAATGRVALELCARSDLQIHLLVTDVVMPEMGGRELAAEVVDLRPGIRVLFMSGYDEDEVLLEKGPEADTAFIGKPFGPRELAQHARQLLDAPEGGASRARS